MGGWIKVMKAQVQNLTAGSEDLTMKPPEQASGNQGNVSLMQNLRIPAGLWLCVESCEAVCSAPTPQQLSFLQSL